MSLNDVTFVNGMIFVCDASTQEDMIKYQIFGLPSTYKREMKQLVPGESALFLLEKHTNYIKGIFVPTSTSKRLIVSNIWKRGEQCAFPSQIKFGLFCRMPPFRKHSYIAPEFLKNMKCKGKFLDRKRTEMLIQAFKENAYRMALEKHVFSAQTIQREAAAEQYKMMVLANQQKQTTYNKMKDQITNLQDEIELLRGERYLYEVARDNLNEERLRLHDLTLSQTAKNTASTSMPVTIRKSKSSHEHSAATTESAAGRTCSRSPARKNKPAAVDDTINVLAEGIDRLKASASLSGAKTLTKPSASASLTRPDAHPSHFEAPHYPQVEYNPYLEKNPHLLTTPQPSIDLSYPYANEFDIPQARVVPGASRHPGRYPQAEYVSDLRYLAPTPGLPTAYPAAPEYHYPLRVDSPYYPAPRSHHLVGYPTHI